VVDNASTDGSREAIERYHRTHPELLMRFLVNDENKGYAAAVNQGVQETDTPYVLVANADVEFERFSELVEPMAQFMDDHPRAAIVGPRLTNPDGSLQLSWGREPHLLTEGLQRWWWRRLEATHRLGPYAVNPRRVDWVLGACFLVRRDAFNRVDGMDPTRYHMYFEEVDLCSRLRRADWEVWYLPAGAAAVHHGQASTRQVADQMAVEYRRSQLQFYRRFHGVAAERLLRGYLWVKFVWTAQGRRLLHAIRHPAG
ncbi:MAG: glycosyltransferase family 2 protein, partial [Candidatus Omnitrophica bacterium]|nr:glycosyltransferase family 2 protein [Candidatus Omnitrophota bacterium]